MNRIKSWDNPLLDKSRDWEALQEHKKIGLKFWIHTWLVLLPQIGHMCSSQWLMFVCSLPSSVLLYVLRNYIPQLPVRSGWCMVLEENWMREKGSQGVCHLQSRWILSTVLTLSSFFLTGPSFWLAVSWSSQRPEMVPVSCLLLWLPVQLSEQQHMMRSLYSVLCVWGIRMVLFFWQIRSSILILLTFQG